VGTHADAEKAPTPEQELRERAVRVAAMLERWQEQDVSTEPDWDPERLERFQLRSSGRAADSE
jgi:hypothetical protein